MKFEAILYVLVIVRLVFVFIRFWVFYLGLFMEGKPDLSIC